MQTCYAGVCRTYTPPDVGAPPRGHQIKSRESEHASNLGSLGQSSFHDWEESLPSTLPCMQDTENPTTKPQGRGKSSTSIFRFLPLVCCVEDADLLLWSMSYIHDGYKQGRCVRYKRGVYSRRVLYPLLESISEFCNEEISGLYQVVQSVLSVYAREVGLIISLLPYQGTLMRQK